MNEDTVPGQLAAINERLDNGDRRMSGIETKLAENTAITSEIKEILAAARLGFKVIGGLGSFIKWAGGAAAAGAALWAMFHHGPKP